jgi:hypothetical protein
MDLPQTIVDVAAQQLREHSIASACTLTVETGYSYPEDGEWFFEECVSSHVFKAVPLCQHVLLQYKGISLKLPRADKAAWEDTVGFLYTTIVNATYDAFEEAGICDDAAGKYDIALKLTAKDTQVFAAHISVTKQHWAALETELRKCLMAVRHVAAVP